MCVLPLNWVFRQSRTSGARPMEISWSNLSHCIGGETEAERDSGLALRLLWILCLHLIPWESQKLGLEGKS